MSDNLIHKLCIILNFTVCLQEKSTVRLSFVNKSEELAFASRYEYAHLTKNASYGIIISMSKRWFCARFAFHTVICNEAVYPKRCLTYIKEEKIAKQHNLYLCVRLWQRTSCTKPVSAKRRGANNL